MIGTSDSERAALATLSKRDMKVAYSAYMSVIEKFGGRMQGKDLAELARTALVLSDEIGEREEVK